MKNGIVIPCYNKAKSLNLSEIQKFIECHPNHTLCFVNYGSQDNTLDVLKSFQRKLMQSHNSLATQVLVCDLPNNSCKITAAKTGLTHLRENTMVKNVGVLNVDHETNTNDVNFTLNFSQTVASLYAA